MDNYKALIARLAELKHLETSLAVLSWDQQCYMPHGGAQERAEQMALLRRMQHEMFTAAETGRLLEAAESETSTQDAHSDERLTLRVIRRKFDKATKLPPELVTDLARSTAIGH